MARAGALMATAFDPSAFIAAEEARRSQAVAEIASDFSWPATELKSAEIRHSSTVPDDGLAAIATLAAPDRKSLPWDRQIEAFVEAPCPPGTRAEFWNELVEEAWDVHRNWASVALDAGWSMLDLFGCNPDPTARRVDRNGLVAGIVSLTTPVRLTAVTERHATLQPRRGDAMRHYRSRAPGSVPLWVAYSNPSGP